MDSVATLSANDALGVAPVERDALFWTELEIRRLGNLVAAGLHAKKYVGDSDEAAKERARMRTLLDAMRRKALRVLHRAEICSHAPDTPWPGLDPDISDPVALAEEYVRVVEKYEAKFGDEETRIRTAPANGRNQNGASSSFVDPFLPDGDEWEKEDAKLYREAVAQAREAAKVSLSARRELLGEEESGLRKRRNTTTKLSKEDEMLMARHQPVQDQLSADLVDIVGRLKGSVSGINEKIVKDNEVIDETEDVVEKNLAGVSRQRDDLTSFSNSTSLSWWMLAVITVVVLIVFIFVFLMLKIPI